jgi:hypothetical protein
MTHRFGTLLATAVLAHLTHLTGCSSPVQGGGSYSSLKGTLEVVEAASYDETMKATMSAMEDMSLRPHINDRDGFRTFIVGASDFGVLSQTHEVRVWVTRIDDSSTRIEMRIFGRRDEDKLTVIKNEIEKRLGKTAPAAVAVPASASTNG